MFENRYQAGEELAKRLQKEEIENPYVLSLPRGGIPLGYKIAEALRAPMDVVVARKIGLPWNLELAVGAVAESGVVIIDEPSLDATGISRKSLDSMIKEQQDEVKKRVAFYRQGRSLPDLSPFEAIVVDDGLATGLTMLAGVKAIQKYSPKKIFLSIPVCSKESAKELQKYVDQVICLSLPVDLEAIGYYYRHFEQVNDKEALALLQKTQKTYHRPDIYSSY